MTEQCVASPMSPSLPTTPIRACSLGMSDGSRWDNRAQSCDDEIQAGEADGTYDVEDVQPLQTLVTPELPSCEVIEAHRIDHWPYRARCKEFVEGFARERDHGHRNQKIAMISMGFCDAQGPHCRPRRRRMA